MEMITISDVAAFRMSFYYVYNIFVSILLGATRFFRHVNNAGAQIMFVLLIIILLCVCNNVIIYGAHLICACNNVCVFVCRVVEKTYV